MLILVEKCGSFHYEYIYIYALLLLLDFPIFMQIIISFLFEIKPICLSSLLF